MPKIAINMLYLDDTMNSGVGKHIEDILGGLLALNTADTYYLLMQHSFYEQYFAKSIIGKRVKDNSSVKIIKCSEGKFFRAIFARLGKNEWFAQQLMIHQVILRYFLKKHSIDLVFTPFHNSVNYVYTGIPTVTVLHDLFYLNFPVHSRNWRRKMFEFYLSKKHEAMIKKATVVVTLSDYSKSDIFRHFPGVEKEKIMVIPNAVIRSVHKEKSSRINRPYLLCVGTHGVHKNQITLLSAFRLIRNQIAQSLVLLGDEAEKTADIISFIEDNNLEDRVLIIKNIADAERNWLYANTDLYVSPSLHEGFGRTPIEAAMHGAMVLTSRETSLPEVTMDLLNYYEPATDENALAEKILYLLANPNPEEKRKEIAETYKDAYSVRYRSPIPL